MKSEIKVTASMDLKPYIDEARELAQALLEHANRLEEIDKKYSVEREREKYDSTMRCTGL